jgi:hypothetical protein
MSRVWGIEFSQSRLDDHGRAVENFRALAADANGLDSAPVLFA